MSNAQGSGHGCFTAVEKGLSSSLSFPSSELLLNPPLVTSKVGYQRIKTYSYSTRKSRVLEVPKKYVIPKSLHDRSFTEPRCLSVV